jgi:hypothetical protein
LVTEFRNWTLLNQIAKDWCYRRRQGEEFTGTTRGKTFFGYL